MSDDETMNLTQGCTIEWKDENETLDSSNLLSNLFASPTPRKSVKTSSTDSKTVPSTESKPCSSIAPDSANTIDSPTEEENLSTQPRNNSEKGMDQQIRNEVDMIYSISNSQNAKSIQKKAMEQETPKIMNGDKRLDSKEISSLLNGLNDGILPGNMQRRKRRQMLEKRGKRLFNMKKQGKKRKQHAVQLEGRSSFDDLVSDLQEFSQDSNADEDNEALEGEDGCVDISLSDGNTPADMIPSSASSSSMPTQKTTNESGGNSSNEMKAAKAVSALNSSSSSDQQMHLTNSATIENPFSKANDSYNNSNHSTKPLPSNMNSYNKVTGQINSSIHGKKSSSTIEDREKPLDAVTKSVGDSNQVQENGTPLDESDPFNDIEFNDDIFAALDAAVQQRQTQSVTQNQFNHSAISSTNTSDNSQSSQGKALQRADTLPTSNRTSDNPPASVGVENNTSRVLSHSAASNTPAVPCTNSNNSANVDDEFGDFAMMDFDAIDQMVAQHNTVKQNEAVGVEFTSCTRYRIGAVRDSPSTFSKEIDVSLWSEEQLQDNKIDSDNFRIVGTIHLGGEWYTTQCAVGDVIHICSLSGRYNTEPAALPISLQTMGTTDDLVMILHPDNLITPTTISDTVSCLRRAILKSRMGSSGISSKAAVIGQMRHSLFEKCLLNNNFTKDFAHKEALDIVRSNGDTLIGCGMLNEQQILCDVVRILPNIQKFASKYTTFTGNNAFGNVGGVGQSPSIDINAEKIHGTEEFAISTELGMKGYIDVTIESVSRPPHGMMNYIKEVKPERRLMGVELKTGHNQTPQHGHMAQLSLYTMALRTRYGTAISGSERNETNSCVSGKGGMLLYLNEKGINAVHVSPQVSELKSLLNQRNVVAVALRKAAEPRGVIVEKQSTDKVESFETDGITVLPPTPAVLPDLLLDQFACERCYASRECMLNLAVESRDSNGVVSVDKRHNALLTHYTGNLQDADLKYFQEWDRLIDLEASVCNKEITKSWLKSSIELERTHATTISSLVLDMNVKSTENESALDEGDVNITCLRSPCSQSNIPMNSLRFEVQNRVVLSTDDHSNSPKTLSKMKALGLLRATVSAINENSIQIRMSYSDYLRTFKIFRETSSSPVLFRIDKEDFTTGTSTLRQNLMNLLTGENPNFSRQGSSLSQEKLADLTQRLRCHAPRVRKSIIHLEPPTFTEVDLTPILNSTGLLQEFNGLNYDQQCAVYKVLSANDYSIVQGFPGTGKTSTIVFILRILLALNKRVLVTSYTHSAVDNILMKLEQYIPHKMNESDTSDIVRIGRKSSVHPAVHKYLASEIGQALQKKLNNIPTKNNMKKNPSDLPSIASLSRVISSAKVVGVSALTVPKSPLLIGQHFDLVIVDEAGQISQPATIGAILEGQSFALVGDHEQLPPLVQSEAAEKAGYSISMMKRLAHSHPESVAQLTLQYRMNDDISLLSNILVYEGRMKSANQNVGARKVAYTSFPKALKNFIKPGQKGLGWLLPSLNPIKHVVFINTDNLGQNLESTTARSRKSSRSGGLVNDVEVLLSKMVLIGLLGCGLDPSSVGVISPFRAQVNRFLDDNIIRRHTENGLDVSTIDKYQGKDKDVIILSMVRSNDMGKTGRLLEDKRRLNVALSRAKSKLIILGSYKTLSEGSLALRPVFDEMKKRNWIETLPANAMDIYNMNTEI
ncbi:hypothetical protein CTEN210_15254 [Chaetoceros tenuissimus]|uniref:DNA helicase n=1 Tax=Chaetoceros tenuissimus TaxID=426638 RepID=A0AAD3D6K5_9STRA|nr:hypothetical protein CTEN210_15254 [Chaetoceros tenuissimus]